MRVYDRHKIYIFGASGSGTTTLGAALAEQLGLVHVDSDDHFWAPVDPPYSKKRTPEERLASLHLALGTQGWVLSGACESWSGDVLNEADLIVFLYAPTPIRIARLIARETRDFGARISEGGDMHRIHTGFIAWANDYETPGFQGRSLLAHQTWLAEQDKPICRVDGDQSLDVSLKDVLSALDAISPKDMATAESRLPNNNPE